MERQRERIKKSRKRFKAQKERQRQKLKAEKAKAGTMTKADPDSECQCEDQPGNEDPEPDDEVSDIWSGFFPWATSGGFSDNFLTGLGLAVLGALGALVLVFGLIGSYLPSMGGKAEYDDLQFEIAALTKRREKQLVSRESFVRGDGDVGREQRQEAANLTQDLGQVIQVKEEEARRKHRQALTLGIPIYIVVGGALAVLLATNALQALLIGFAWTSIADRLGLKREQAERKAIKDPEAEKLEKDAKAGANANAALRDKDAEIAELAKALADATETAARIKSEK